MSFQYWEYKSEQERLEALSLLQNVNIPQEDNALHDVNKLQSVETTHSAVPEDIPVAAEEAEVPSVRHKKSVARCIFVDGFLGLPFITIVLVLISALVAAFTIVTLVCGFASLACFAGSVLALAYAFISFGSAVATAFLILGSGLVLGAFSCLLIVATALLGSRCVPFIASLYLRLVKKLHLFK